MGIFALFGPLGGEAGDSTVVVDSGGHWADPSLREEADLLVDAERGLS